MTLKQCFYLTICFQRWKIFLTSKFFWHFSHDGGFGITKLCIIPLREHHTQNNSGFDSATCKQWPFQTQQKGHNSKIIVLLIVSFNYFKKIIFGLEIILKTIPFLASQRTLWATSGVGGKGRGGGWGGWCRIRAWTGRLVVDKSIPKVLF